MPINIIQGRLIGKGSLFSVSRPYYFSPKGGKYLRIDSCNIGMDSARLYKSASALRTSYAGADISAQGNEDALMPFGNLLTDEGENDKEEADKKVSKDLLANPFDSFKARNIDLFSTSAREASNEFHRLHQMMFRSLFYLLFGAHKGSLEDEEMCDETAAEEQQPMMQLPSGNSYRMVTRQFTSSGYYSESETTRFRVAGNVRTADGRSIDINMNLLMSRSFASYYEEHHSIETLQVCDPLVINFDGNPAGLDKEYSFFFDLDADGQEEKIAKLTSGSGFLALDLNEDGVINDGSELFGPRSGDGFSDLASYDEDGNGWIDEGDAIFEKLKIWSKDQNGNDILYSLKELDIGALFTGAVDTQFSLNDADNATQGYVRQTGFFLYEDGAAGTMQHIDLVS